MRSGQAVTSSEESCVAIMTARARRRRCSARTTPAGGSASLVSGQDSYAYSTCEHDALSDCGTITVLKAASSSENIRLSLRMASLVVPDVNFGCAGKVWRGREEREEMENILKGI